MTWTCQTRQWRRRADLHRIHRRDAKIRLEKTEEETTELNNKAKTLEGEVDVFREKLSVSEITAEGQGGAGAGRQGRVQLAQQEGAGAGGGPWDHRDQVSPGSQKLDKAATTADNSSRMKKMLENREHLNMVNMLIKEHNMLNKENNTLNKEQNMLNKEHNMLNV